MAGLLDYIDGLRRQQPGWEVPDLDPANGGVVAKILFLLEKPGPSTTRFGGSGFVSINNDNQTARAIHAFAIRRNRLPLGACLFANAVPWWDGTRTIGAEQRRLSAGAIAELLPLLPDLRAIVLVGGTARQAWRRSGLTVPANVRLWQSDHPSPQVRAAFRARWEAIPSCWPTIDDLDGVAPGA